MNINYILNNDLIIYSFYTVSVSLIFVYFIKSKFYSSVIETNNTPTLNFSQRELSEIQEFMNQGGVLNPEINNKLEQDLQTIMGEDYDKFIHTFNFYNYFKTIV